MKLSSFGVPTEGDATSAIQAALDAAAGGVLEFDVAATYTVGRLYPRSNTTLVLGRHVAFTKRLNAAGVFYLSNVSNVRILANGATVYGDDVAGTTSFGHTIYALGTIDCEIRDLTVDGASAGGGGKDCLYIGLGATPNTNLRVIGGKYLRAKRNGISVVSGFNTLIEDVECAYTTGGPGAGIDVEANAYGQVAYTTIRRARCHHNATSGIINSFGVATLVEDCDLHDNGVYGFGASAGGGAVFAQGVYRPNKDVIAVTGFDPATGAVHVSALPPVGTPVMFSAQAGGQKPAAFTGTYMIVSRHASPTSVILGRAVGIGEVTSCGESVGTLSADPATSALRLLAFVDGQSDRCEIRRSRAFRNGEHGMIVAGACRVRASDCEFRDNTGYSQVWIGHTRDVVIDRLRVSGRGLGLVAQSGGGRLRITDCDFEGVLGRALVLADWADAEMQGNSFDDCASQEISGYKAAVHMTSCLRPRFNRNRITQAADNTTTLFGVLADHSVLHGEFVGNVTTGAGTTAANALFVVSATCRVEDNIGRDGAPY